MKGSPDAPEEKVISEQDIPTKPDSPQSKKLRAALEAKQDESYRSVSAPPGAKTKLINELAHGVSDLLPVLHEILGHMHDQINLDVALERKLRMTNRWLVTLTLLAACSLVLCGMIALRMHVTVQRLEMTELKVVQLSKSLKQNLEVSLKSRELAEEIRLYERRKPSVMLLQDDQKPERVKVVIVPPTESEAEEDKGTKKEVGGQEQKSLELPVRLPRNVSVGDK